MKRSLSKCLVLGCLCLVLICAGTPAAALTDSAQVPAGWAVWSCWYWSYNDWTGSIYNLWDDYGAMYKYDRIDPAANYAQLWEYNNHGPNVGQPDWAGHCHAWSGASVWEAQPTASRTVSGQTFLIRDRKGLMCEAYFKDTSSSDLFVDNPNPGTFWRWLRREIKGAITPMHGHRMGFIGELYWGAEVWNYPVYKYLVTYSGNPASGTIKIWVASDGQPSYADSTTLYVQTRTYYFKGVKFSGGNPISSGYWTGSGSSSRPDCIWRPKYPNYWTTYRGDPYLRETYLGKVLN